jgi:hypothetical protein
LSAPSGPPSFASWSQDGAFTISAIYRDGVTARVTRHPTHNYARRD